MITLNVSTRRLVHDYTERFNAVAVHDYTECFNAVVSP